MRSASRLAWLFPVAVIGLFLATLWATVKFYSPAEPVGALESGAEQIGVLWALLVASWGTVFVQGLCGARKGVTACAVGTALVGLWTLGLPKSVFGLLVVGVAGALALLSGHLLGAASSEPLRQLTTRRRRDVWSIGVVFFAVLVALLVLYWLGELLVRSLNCLSTPLWPTSGGGFDTSAQFVPGLYTIDTLWRGGLIPLWVLASLLVLRRVTKLGSFGLTLALVPILLQVPDPPTRLFPWVAALESFMFVVCVLHPTCRSLGRRPPTESGKPPEKQIEEAEGCAPP